MTVPYTFANVSGQIPLSELDANFAALNAHVDTAGTVTTNAQPNITSVGTLNSLTVSGNITSSGNITADYFLGNVIGSFSNAVYANTAGFADSANVANVANVAYSVAGANVVGAVANATYALTAATATSVGTANIANIANVAYSVAGANVSGAVANATYALTANTATFVSTANTATFAGTVTTNAQPNITSVGNLTSLIVSGNSTVINNFTVGANATISGSANVGANLLVVGNVGGNNFTILGNVSTSGVINAGGDITTSATINTASLLSGNISTYGGNSYIYSAGGIYANNQISATGNITTAGYFIGTFVGNVSGNLVVPGSNTQVLYNNSGNAGASGNLTFNNATQLLAVGGNVSASGNITGSYILGNGSQLTGIPVSYGNSNVNTLLSAWGSNTLSTTGNITGGYIFGNGSQLTGLSSTYGNSNVATYLPTYTGNLRAVTGAIATANATANVTIGPSSGNLVVPGNLNVDSGFLRTTASTAYLFNLEATTVNMGSAADLINIGSTLGVVNFQGNISVASNVTGAYISGNGSRLSSLTAANITGTVANATYAATAGSAGTVTTNAQPNITSVGTLTSLTSSGNISTSGNVTGGYILGNGSQLTGIVSSYGNSNVATYLPTYTGNLTNATGPIAYNGTGNLLFGPSVAGNVVMPGNLFVQGGSLRTTSNIGYIFNNNTDTVNFAGAANAVYIGSSLGVVNFPGNVSVAGNVTANNLTGPIFASYNTANIALTNNAATVLKYTGIRTNTNSYYSTTTGEFIPLTAGWYQVNAAMLPQYVSGTQQVSTFLALYKNGNIIASGPATTLTSTWGTITNSSLSTLVNLNGSTDWIGIAAIVTTNTGVWQVGISEACFFQACWVRGL
jgi:hypothetical protein